MCTCVLTPVQMIFWGKKSVEDTGSLQRNWRHSWLSSQEKQSFVWLGSPMGKEKPSVAGKKNDKIYQIKMCLWNESKWNWMSWDTKGKCVELKKEWKLKFLEAEDFSVYSVLPCGSGLTQPWVVSELLAAWKGKFTSYELEGFSRC